MFDTAQKLTVTIQEMAATGAGIAYVEGIRTFVPGAMTGDRVRILWQKPAKGTQSVVAQRVVLKGPSRARHPEPCLALSAKPACGGCPLGGLIYKAQIVEKTNLLRQALRQWDRLSWGRLIKPMPLLVAQKQFRNKAYLKPVIKNGTLAFGMYASQSHRVCPIALCDQLVPWMNEAHRVIARVFQEALIDYEEPVYSDATQKGFLRGLLLRDGGSTGRMVVVVVSALTDEEKEKFGKLLKDELAKLHITSLQWNIHSQANNRTLGDQYILIDGTRTMLAELMECRFHVGPQTFMQANRYQTKVLYERALALARLTEESRVLDLYCGVGTLTILAAKVAKQAHGIEIVPESIEAAKRNAEENGVENVSFEANPVEKALSHLPFTPDVVIADPAFKGMAENVPEELAQLCVPRIVYVSCNPKTLVRDLVAFEKLGYEVKTIEPLDLFPGSLHLETVVLLRRAL